MHKHYKYLILLTNQSNHQHQHWAANPVKKSAQKYIWIFLFKEKYFNGVKTVSNQMAWKGHALHVTERNLSYFLIKKLF